VTVSQNEVSQKEISLHEVLTTTRTVRRGLDFSRPVARALIEECLALACHAPNGANRQNWRFLVLDDPAVKAGVAEHYRRASGEYLAGNGLADTPMGRSGTALAERLHEAPALVLACQLGRLGPDALPAKQSSFFGSVYPALWGFMLAARGRGLGTALTTVHLAYEREVAQLLGIPYDQVTQVALVVVGHLSTPAKPPRRGPVADVIAHNTWRWA
jgi:nitroreductase